MEYDLKHSAYHFWNFHVTRMTLQGVTEWCSDLEQRFEQNEFLGANELYNIYSITILGPATEYTLNHRKRGWVELSNSVAVCRVYLWLSIFLNVWMFALSGL